ncbi:MAG: hypothetical protein HY619_04690 [Thaumarchaeota archaeon]|nr:hypothetical protein [Nitrososphaerota archaeon]
MRPPEARERVREFFLDGRAHCLREFLQRYGLSEKEAYAALYRGWKEGLLLRTKKPILQSEKVFHGRNSTTSHIRPYHLYIWKTGVSSLFLDGLEYVPYSIQNLDPRGGGVLSKAKMILNFLKEHSDKAWFSREIVNALKDKGVKIADVMSAARRYAKKDMLYIRGYKTDRRQTPFQQGFLLTWLDKTKPWQQAIDGALVRTDVALDGKASQTPIAHRIRRIRNIVYETSRLGEVVSVAYLQNTLGCNRPRDGWRLETGYGALLRDT